MASCASPSMPARASAGASMLFSASHRQRLINLSHCLLSGLSRIMAYSILPACLKNRLERLHNNKRMNKEVTNEPGGQIATSHRTTVAASNRHDRQSFSQ